MNDARIKRIASIGDGGWLCWSIVLDLEDILFAFFCSIFEVVGWSIGVLSHC